MKKSAMRIALMTGNYSGVPDGAAGSLQRLVGHFRQRGAEVRVFEPECGHPGEVRLPSIAVPGRPEYRVGTGLGRGVRKALSDFDPHIVQVATPDLAAFEAVRYARAHGIPVVGSFHTNFGTYLRYYHLRALAPLITRFVRRLYNRCDRVYVPSAAIRHSLKENGYSADLRIWSRGVDSTLFSPDRRDLPWRRSLGFADDDIVVIWVSRIVREKDPATVARAISRARETDARIRPLIVGDGGFRPQLEAMLPEACFTGFLRGDELARAYASADIFAFASVTEAFGNVTLEALSSGLPCVVAESTASRSLVSHGVSGTICPPEDINELANAIENLAAQPLLRRSYGFNARRTAERYDWNRILESLYEDYREIASLPAVEPQPVLAFNHS